MKNIIITGATGMIGSMILEQCLANSDVHRVTILVRKTTGIRHPKLVEVIHADFLNYDAVAQHLANQDVCCYCIGVYTGQVPREQFREITVDYTKAFAAALRAQNHKTTFCFLSGDGADSSEKSRIMFARDKGVAENILFGLQFHQTYIFRPGYIYPTNPRKEPNRAYVVFRYLYKGLFQYVYPNIGVTSGHLSKAMVHTGLYGAGKAILENKDIRHMKVSLPGI